jgi:hypothetical protein
MVITPDSDSGNPGSIPGTTFGFSELWITKFSFCAQLPTPSSSATDGNFCKPYTPVSKLFEPERRLQAPIL